MAKDLYTLYQRGNIWWAWVPERQADGSQKYVRKSTEQVEKDLARKRASELAAIGTAPYRAAEKTTLERCLNQLIVDRERADKSPATIGMYRNSCGHLLRLLGGDIVLADLTRAMVEDFIDTRLKENAARNSIHKDLVALKKALKIAVDRDEYDLNPSKLFPEFKPENEPQRNYLTHEQATRFLKEIPADRQAHVKFILATGARWSESLRAEKSDINFKAGTIFLRGTKTEKSLRKFVMAGHMKGMLESVCKDSYARDSGPMFLPWRNYRRGLLAACKRANVPPTTPNDLRRTFASWLRDAGGDIKWIADLLGHADTRETIRTYVQTTASDVMARRVKPLAKLGSKLANVSAG